MKRKTKKKEVARSDAQSSEVAKPDPRTITIGRYPEESESDAFGRNAIRPTVGAAMTIKEYGSRYGDNLAVMGLVSALSSEAKKAANGDLARAEHMLTVQAHTLDAIFNTLARRAARNMDEYLDAAERFMRLALKAQSQCRATLETLALMKNPAPVAFVRQANIGQAVQVNNGTASGPRARETDNLQNKLLEAQHGERLDTGTAGAAIGADSTLAAVAKIYRAEVGRG